MFSTFTDKLAGGWGQLRSQRRRRRGDWRGRHVPQGSDLRGPDVIAGFHYDDNKGTQTRSDYKIHKCETYHSNSGTSKALSSRDLKRHDYHARQEVRREDASPRRNVHQHQHDPLLWLLNYRNFTFCSLSFIFTSIKRPKLGSFTRKHLWNYW